MEDGEGGCGRGPLGGAGGTQHWELGTHEGSTVHQQLLRWGEEVGGGGGGGGRGGVFLSVLLTLTTDLIPEGHKLSFSCSQ